MTEKIELIKEYKVKLVASNAEAVFEQMKDIKDAKKEFFVAFYLDSKLNIICREIVSIGTLNTSLIHPRELFRGAILRAAHAIIIAHNHPSGDTSPSDEDLQVTEKLVAAGKLLGISVLDHIIVGDDYKSII